MDDDRSRLRLFLFRLIPALLVVSLVGWCSYQGNKRKELEPVRTEITDLMMTEGLVDSPSPGNLADVAKRAGQPAMNRLLYNAAPTATLEAIRWIIRNGADPKNVGMQKDRTLLQQAAKTPRFEKLDFFLGLGLDPLERSRDGRSVLHFAAEGGLDERTIALLQSKGIALDDRTPTGAAALHFASVKSIPVLVQAGQPVNVTDSDGRTPLHAAARAGRLDVVNELLRSGASVFAADNKGRTPLHLAVLGRSTEVVDALLAAGAPRTVRDQDGNTPRDTYQDSMRNRNRNDYRNDFLSRL